jgi:hypothetical protein
MAVMPFVAGTPRWAGLLCHPFNAFKMNPTGIFVRFAFGLLLLIGHVWSQKINTGHQAEHSGKSEIKGDEGSSGKSSVRENSNSNASESRPEKHPIWNRSEESSSSQPSHSGSTESVPSYSSPAPTQSYAEPAPASHIQAPASQVTTPSRASEGVVTTGRSEVATRPVIGVATNAPVADEKPGAVDERLPGIQPVPLPMPLDPPVTRGEVDPHGTLFTGDDDSLPRPVVHIGSLGNTSARPDYQVIEPAGPSAPGLPPKPFPSSPRPRPVPGPGTPPQGGGTMLGGSDPDLFDLSGIGFVIPTQGGSMNYMAPELRCIYDASDALVNLYRDANWCQDGFERQYGQQLINYYDCYSHLATDLSESWMWPSYLVFVDERNFWAEECAVNDPELKHLRDLLRAKATYIPFLMVEVDAKKREDWVYVDTAFAAPMGGKNYFATMQEFDPSTVLNVLTVGVRRYPEILNWPSYARVQGLFSEYFRADITALLRSKARQDFGAAITQQAAEPKIAYQLAENAAWICLAITRIDTQDTDLRRLKLQIKSYLRQDEVSWAQSPLHDLLE